MHHCGNMVLATIEHANVFSHFTLLHISGNFSQHFVAWLSTHNGCIRVIPLLIQHLASTERSAIAAWPRRMSEFLLNHAVQPYRVKKKDI